MSELPLFSVVFFFAFAIFLVGLTTMFIRRHAFWMLVGSLVSLKAVGAMALFLSLQANAAKTDFALLALVSLGILPMVGCVGVLVLHRGARFFGTLDLEKEDKLRE